MVDYVLCRIGIGVSVEILSPTCRGSPSALKTKGAFFAKTPTSSHVPEQSFGLQGGEMILDR